MGSLLGTPVNSITDYDFDDYNPYSPDVKIPSTWRASSVPRRRIYRRLSGPESGLGGVYENIYPVFLSAKQLFLDHWMFFLAAGAGVFWLWYKERK